jgi:hypothetical protein
MINKKVHRIINFLDEVRGDKMYSEKEIRVLEMFAFYKSIEQCVEDRIGNLSLRYNKNEEEIQKQFDRRLHHLTLINNYKPRNARMEISHVVWYALEGTTRFYEGKVK